MRTASKPASAPHPPRPDGRSRGRGAGLGTAVPRRIRGGQGHAADELAVLRLARHLLPRHRQAASTTRTISTSMVKQGNGSGNTVRLVANKDSDFAYASAVTMMKLAAQGAPVISVATIDATGTDAVIVNPDSGIKTFKDLEGKKVLTTAGAGVNTMFPVAAANAERRLSTRSSSPTSPRAPWCRAICKGWPRPCSAAWTTSPPRSRPMAASRR